MTDLGSREHDPEDNITEFTDAVENYTNTHAMLEWYHLQEAASPITLIANATSVPAVRLYATDDDAVPHQQAENMKTALLTRFPSADIVEYTMPGALHAFNYWHIQNTKVNPPDCVSHQVITFLQAHP